MPRPAEAVPRWRLAALAAAAAVVVAMAVVEGPDRVPTDTAAPTDTSAAPDTTPPADAQRAGGAPPGPSPGESPAAAPPVDGPDGTGPDGSTDTAIDVEAGFPAVRLLAGADRLDGRVALAPWPFGGEEPMWVIADGRAVGRFDVPTVPGDWPYPLLFAGDGVAFTSDARAVRMAADATGVEPLVTEAAVRYLVAGRDPGDVLAVHSGETGISAFTPIIDGAVGERVPVEGLRWIDAGVADGLVGRLTEPTRGSDLAYWRPGGDPVVLDVVRGRRPVVLAAGGDLLAVRARGGGALTVLDVRTGDAIASIPESTEPGVAVPVTNRPHRACFSPDRRRLAFVEDQPPERVTVIDLDDPTARRLEYRVRGRIDDIVWASDRQLVVAEDDTVSLVDLDTVDVVPVAELHGARSWWIAADAASC
ncbi:MAG: hypothetical protein S0880_01100 [Actinomycetota bacterium]|nr:hypothetical protein [Actinomycetota bacterium]